MRGFACLIFVAGCLSPASSAFADAGPGDSPWIAPRAAESTSKGRSSERRGSSSAGWTTVTASLVVVVMLILVVARMLRQRGLLAPGELPGEALRVLGRKVVDYRHTILLVQCGSRLLVLGSSQAGLTTLAEIVDQSEVDALTENCKTSEPAQIVDGFGALMRRFRSDPGSAPSTPPDADPPPVLRLRERLAAVERQSDDVVDLSSIREGTG